MSTGPDLPAAVRSALTALPEAAVDLRAAGLGPTGVAGICLLDPGVVPVDHATGEVVSTLSAEAAELDPATRVVHDRLDQPWVVMRAAEGDVGGLAAALEFAAASLYDRGYGEYLYVAAVELASPHDGRLYLFYRFDERGFYAFAPRGGEGRRRHEGLERRVVGLVSGTLPTLDDEDAWAPLWGGADDHPWGTAREG